MSELTPALARAKAELMGGLPGLLPFIAAPFAHTIVSAALHDPDDPDWLARVLDAHVDTGDGPTGAECSCGVVMEHTVDGASMDIYVSRHVADAVRAAILGGGAQ